MRELSLAAESLLLELVDPGATGIVVHTSAGWRPVGSKAGAPPHNGFMTNTTWTQATINALASICGLFADGLRVNASGKLHAGTCTCLGQHGRPHLELDWLRVEGVPLPNLEPEPITGRGRDQE